MRLCPGPNCGVTIDSRFAFCRRCWARVSRPLQEAVNRTWAERQEAAGEEAAGEDYQAARHAHEHALARAVEFLRGKVVG